MDYRPLLTQHTAQLTHEIPEWDKAATAVELDPYQCKASYICGAMREFMQAAGLNFEEEYFLAALFLALDATELLGRVVNGARCEEGEPGYIGPTSVLHKGVRYLKAHGNPKTAPLPRSPDDYVHLRNFAGHGASFIPADVDFDRDTIRLLLRHLAYVLNTMWNDPALPANLAMVEIHPVSSVVDGKTEPVFVRHLQEHLAANRPGDGLAHDSWQYDTFRISAASDAVTGVGYIPRRPAGAPGTTAKP
ncbi:hypothetical protein [Streptacidiphilus sp. EB103A]|uniref:hypothetical protein n=1 Tax=Streptacidiphilus sp. EB103A TaxID=3156275 RepID=UPI0035172137